MPHAGTWIEIADRWTCSPAGLSCLTQARGLKSAGADLLKQYHESCLTQARGLKYPRMRVQTDRAVVPHAGTWIEIWSASARA